MPFERSANSSSDCSLMHAKKREGREVENEMQAEEKEEEGRKGGLRGRKEEGEVPKSEEEEERREGNFQYGRAGEGRHFPQ